VPEDGKAILRNSKGKCARYSAAQDLHKSRKIARNGCNRHSLANVARPVHNALEDAIVRNFICYAHKMLRGSP